MNRIKEVSDLFLSEKQMLHQPYEQLMQWVRSGTEINAEPSLLVRFDFMREPMRYLKNRALQGMEKIPEGKAERYFWTAGRSLGKWGVNLQRKQGMIHFNLDRDLSALTLLASVRIDKRMENQTIFASDDFSWKLTPKGTMIVATPGQFVESATIWEDQRLGSWSWVGVSLSSESRKATFYLNGHVIGEEEFRFAGLRSKSITLGPIEGVLDEFLFFAQEIGNERIPYFQQQTH